MPALRQLHWLPVQQRVEFKLADLVYKALNGRSPQYLADDCQLTTTINRLDRLTSLHVQFHELTQLWVIDHSTLLDCMSGTTYRSTNEIANLLTWISTSC